MKKYFDFKNKKAQILMIIAIVTLLSLVIGATYAYYIASENLLTTSRTLEVSTNENVSVVATGNTTLSVDLNLDDMRKFGTTKTFYATSSGKSETETQEHFMNIVSNSSTNIYCTYTATITKSDVPNYSNMIDQIAASGIENEMVLTFLHGNTVMNTFDMKTAEWNENNQILFTGMITDIEPMGTAELDAKMFIRNLANVDQAPYLALSAVALNVELTKINCDSMDSPRIESLANSATDAGILDVTMAEGGYELASYCVDQVEKSTGDCEWISNNDKEFGVPINVSTSGVYYLHVKDIRGYIADSVGFDINVLDPVKEKNYDYEGIVKSLTLHPGEYKLEVWGAQGANSASVGGKGGYSVGILNLIEDTNIFIYVGQNGTGVTTRTFGGGGANPNGASGGGGTDIRIGQDSLYSRVIVAGGGGGGTYSYNASRPGGFGGGTSGGYSTGYSGGTGGSGSCSPGTATSGGIGSYGTTYCGSFGLGASWASGYSYCGGGGGGWYGGGSQGGTTNANGNAAGGGGGSGYVYTTSTASQCPSGCTLTSKYYLNNASTIAGNTSFPSPTGSAEVGHSGHGYARITVLKAIIIKLY